ncbi:hypothetical protein [Rhodanobacter sp. C06]|uniref:hypothetical protein n=1 Tax=Rhodanobacter sp. C06 TaxID=1945854 RepID=UPI0011158651|nr:hypothetical protein [Rhodanobacter sp. C06]
MVVSKEVDENPTLLPDTKMYPLQVIQFHVTGAPGDIRQALLHHNSYMPDPSVFKQKVVNLEEAYLHSTLSNWEGKAAMDKALIVGSSMYRRNAVTFTLRFNHKKGATLRKELGNTFRSLRNQLGSVTALGPTLITVELDKQGRPHLHGIVQTDANLADVRAALGPASGRLSNPTFRKFRLDVRRSVNPVAWVTYITKDLLGLPEQESAKLIYMSQSARQCGKQHLGELRGLAKQKLGITPEWRGRAAAVCSGGGHRVVRRKRAHSLLN